jgi:hypothetical protein
MTFEQAQKLIGKFCDTDITAEWVDDSVRIGRLVGFTTDERGSVLACVRLPNSSYIQQFHPSRVREIKEALKAVLIEESGDDYNEKDFP